MFLKRKETGRRLILSNKLILFLLTFILLVLHREETWVCVLLAGFDCPSLTNILHLSP